MPDFANYSIIQSGLATAANVPRYQIHIDIVNSMNGSFITGFNTNFPGILSQLQTGINSEFTDFVEMATHYIIRKKLGF